MVVTVGRVLIRHSKVFSLGLYSMEAILGQQVQYIRESQRHVQSMKRLVIILGNDLGISWLLKKGQHMFLFVLFILMYVMIMGRMIILVKSVPSISWLANWEQLMFLARFKFQGLVMTVDKQATSLNNVLKQDYQSFNSSKSVLQCCGTFDQR